MKALALLLLLISFNSYSIPEDQFNRSYGAQVTPYFLTMMDGTFKNEQGLKIRWRAHIKPAARKTLVIFPGRTEASIKYAELMFDLQSEDMNIFIIDHQGQGESGRLFQRADKCHVRSFAHYISDAEQFMKKVVIPNSKGTDRYLLGHSMGGLIAVHYLKRNPTHFKKAILSAPMLQINTGKIGEWKSYLMAKAMWLAGKGSRYIPYGRPYSPEIDTFDRNFSTTSEVRFNLNKGLWLNDPRLQVGAPTVTWTKESILWGRYVPTFAAKIKTPIVIMNAGNDRVVRAGRMKTFCDRAPNCRFIRYPNAEHGILEERDAIRDVAVARIKDFLAI